MACENSSKVLNNIWCEQNMSTCHKKFICTVILGVDIFGLKCSEQTFICPRSQNKNKPKIICNLHNTCYGTQPYNSRVYLTGTSRHTNKSTGTSPPEVQIQYEIYLRTHFCLLSGCMQDSQAPHGGEEQNAQLVFLQTRFLRCCG